MTHDNAPRLTDELAASVLAGTARANQPPGTRDLHDGRTVPVLAKSTKCHGSPACPRAAIGHVRMPGRGHLWVPVCGRHVGPWTIQGAKYVALLATLVLAGCTATPTVTPAPTASPVPTATPRPTAEPTPRLVEVEVAVVPEACFDALESARQMMVTDTDFRIALLDAYLDFPDENLAEFGKRVEALLNGLGDGSESTVLFDEYLASLDECYAKADR